MMHDNQPDDHDHLDRSYKPAECVMPPVSGHAFILNDKGRHPLPLHSCEREEYTRHLQAITIQPWH
ncbi:hypothetical protein WOLCODRAFT_26257 [Wolfiporia cocos MD-104 SS10]|uniref:Uncharacterized protein n=1 Tax=Wolfiporia cocos (strain MD-104) TaxID=742152 RepID=A0A2H3JQT6_WOLCO|nr:hypothetical protein WOLCODRAFT_26257 [Wolfiporia cocos MD-104 SS10]